MTYLSICAFATLLPIERAHSVALASTDVDVCFAISSSVPRAGTCRPSHRVVGWQSAGDDSGHPHCPRREPIGARSWFGDVKTKPTVPFACSAPAKQKTYIYYYIPVTNESITGSTNRKNPQSTPRSKKKSAAYKLATLLV